MRPPPEISVLALADAILDLRRAEARHVGAVICVHRRRFRRALIGQTFDRRDLEFTLQICVDWLCSFSPELRASGFGRRTRCVEIATPLETAAFLEAAEALRRAPLVARAVVVLGSMDETWRRGHYLRRRVEFVKLDAARRGATEREVRAWRFAFIDDIARQRAGAARGSTSRSDK